MQSVFRMLILVLVLVCGLVTNSPAVEWQLKEMGVGVYDESQGYDTVLNVLQRGERWSQKQLYEQGYFANREKKFGAWLVGPPVDSYLNRYGTPLYSYKYRLTEPSGKSSMFGPHGFYKPGFATVFINASGQTGSWKIEFYLWNRDTDRETLVDSKVFVIEP
ncbi:MAG: hypothetical protein PHN92_11460 [Geobacter sp.]|nr:hypothetical protein [Geobacter sp.]